MSGGFAGINETFSLTSAFSSLTIEGVRYAGRELGLDPTITSIIGTSAATIVSVGLGGTMYYDKIEHCPVYLTGLDAISYTIGTTVLPNVASELAYYGITKIGDVLGIPEISMIAGMGIRSTISAGFRGYDANDIFRTAIGGMTQGIISIGINYATQKLGLNPLLANLGFSAIASALNAGIQAATGGSQDVFKTFFDTYINNALTFLGYGNITDPNYAWLEASYKSSILDFSDIVRRKEGIDGLIDALNTYGLGFFNSTTVGAITQSGMTIGRYFANKLENGEGTTETKNGNTYTKVAVTIGDDPTVLGEAFFDKLTNPDGSYIWTLVGKGEYYTDHYFWGLGVLGKDSYGNLGFWNDATLIDDYYVFKNTQHIDSGDFISGELKDPNANNLVNINPTPFSERVEWNAYGELLEAIINDSTNGFNVTYTSSSITDYTSSSLLGLNSKFLEEYLALDEYDILSLDDISINLEKSGSSYDISIGLVDTTRQVDLGTLNALYKIASFIDNVYLPNAFAEDIGFGGYVKHTYSNNFYAIVDENSGYEPVEIYRKGLSLIGDKDKVGSGQALNLVGYGSVINGEVWCDVSSDACLIARIDNGIASSVRYCGYSPSTYFVGEQAEDGTLLNGYLYVRGVSRQREVMCFVDGQPIGYYDTLDPNGSINPLDCDKIISLFTTSMVLGGQVGSNGIYSLPLSGPEPDFTAYNQEIFSMFNQLFPEYALLNEASLTVFKNGDNATNVFDFYYNLAKRYYTLRDPTAVVFNTFTDFITNELRDEYKRNYESQDGFLDDNGVAYIMESGSKTGGIGHINDDMLRAYTVIGVSANISEKIANPYVKFFVNFTTNYEKTNMFWPLPDQGIPGINDSYSTADIFRYPTNDVTVWNIQFDDVSANAAMSDEYRNMHVDYARKTNSPYHAFFVKASALAEYAVYDGGEGFKQFVMQAKGFTNDSQLQAYLIQSGGKVLVNQDDVNRAFPPRN